MITAIEPSFSKGLIHLSNLFDCVMNYDENIGNSHDDDNATLLIRTALQSASNSLNATESISAQHLKTYEENLLFFPADIAAKENLLTIENIELEHLTIAINIWQLESDKLRKEIAELDAKVIDADQRATHSQRRIDRRVKNRWKWITATVLTVGKLIILLKFYFYVKIFPHYLLTYRTSVAWTYSQRERHTEIEKRSRCLAVPGK